MKTIYKTKIVKTIILSMVLVGTTLAIASDAVKKVEEKELGLRHTNLYNETKVLPSKTNYTKKYPGSSTRFKRAFQDAPPMIPHSVEGLIPIQANNNQCLGCHIPEVAPSVGSTPLPQSHFMDFRPKHKMVKKTFVKSIDNMKNEVSIKKMPQVSNARFNCTQCHAPQSKTKAPENDFKADYLNKNGASRSSWSGSKLTEGLDTLIGD
jgi:cytochrome c-type protein NapB